MWKTVGIELMTSKFWNVRSNKAECTHLLQLSVCSLLVGRPTMCFGPCPWPGSPLHTVCKVQSPESWFKSPEMSFYPPLRVGEPLGDRLTSQIHVLRLAGHCCPQNEGCSQMDNVGSHLPGTLQGVNGSRRQLPAQKLCFEHKIKAGGTDSYQGTFLAIPSRLKTCPSLSRGHSG